MPPNANPESSSSSSISTTTTITENDDRTYGTEMEIDEHGQKCSSPTTNGQIRRRKVSHAEQLMMKMFEEAENVGHMLHNAWNVRYIF